MICIEERGQEPKCSAPVEPAALHSVSTGSFAFRFRLGATFAREDRVRRVCRRFDVAVAQIATADADLLGVHRDTTDRGRTTFRAARTAFAHQDAISSAVQNVQRSAEVSASCRTRCIYRPFVAHLVIADVDASVAR